ncbi:pyruvate dehydrogenase E2 component (dihydrolipoamide acetyltransferase) [Rhizomicrobium palustre]|uniref:Acetyltransferase component of pyruvate dehydrogenase complex n=1 Tax=Rhizomicrobium palustre TaxID=189966 RepID=A0A846N3C8_9PROT|nr:pyruvate dehydrogenase complex dihydrolipoamide acetyltransferase [Rhizomicrobium palustre]NIK89722.1 pyruvate dehydrogenase E2 component (dihydrolipoamide acetyltransferase) [Rhizomicrobium palustre]
MTTQILMPALSPTMEEGKLAKWHVKEGDAVKSGDILAEIETDKATMEFEAVDEGKIGKILIAEGTEGVKVNTLIAILLEEGEDASAITDIPAAMSDIKAAVSAEAKDTKEAKAEPAAPVAAAAAPAAHGERIFASPLAKRIAAQKGIDLAAIAGSGPRGRIVKSDVEHATPGAAPKAAPVAAAPKAAAPTSAPVEVAAPQIGGLPDARIYSKPGEYEEIPHDSMRKAIAKRLTAAKSLVPHIYVNMDITLDALLAARERLNAAAPKGKDKVPAYKLSVNDFVIKAVAMALKKVPEINASWTDTAVLRHKHADIGVAVALDFGLITPIVARAEEKGLVEISNEVKSLVERAKGKKLKPNEYEGGSFAISNMGMFGVSSFSAIINPPHAAILAVGAGIEKPVVKNDKIEIATVMTVTLSVDHRVVDGAAGAKFLVALKQFLEEPAAMLL